MKKLISFFFIFVFSFCLAASQEQYPFKKSEGREQFQRLLKELRCLVCQNQDLADSNASLAKDLKNIVYEQVLQKKTDEQIKSFLTKRYGDFILFNPPIKQQTYLLWFGPFILLLGGIIFLCRFVIRMRRNA